MNRERPWVDNAIKLLEQSLETVALEQNQLDWKVNLSPDKERLIQHLSAFSNCLGGGVLVFGVADTAEIQNLSTQKANEIINNLASLGRDGLEPPVVIDHAVREFHDKQILFVKIHESLVKPVHRRGKSIDHCWIRSGGSTRKASQQEIRAMILNSSNSCWEELRASSTMEIPEVCNLLDLRTIARLLERPLPQETEQTAKWLLDEKIIVEESSGYSISNFGAISAAVNLENFPKLERKRIRLVQYKGRNKVEAVNEIIGAHGYAVGFEKLIAYIKSVVPHSEVIEQALRTEVSIYPDIALRELTANALIHQDFSVSGTSPMIELYDDRIEFTNPGGLLPSKSVDRLIGASPESRNELLAAAFRRYRICEERGSGFQKVVAAIELFGLPPLGFRQAENSFTVILHAPRRFSEMSQQERIEACYQHAVLQYLSNSTMTNTSMRERFKMNEKQRNQITSLISEAIIAGRIKRKDPESGNKFAEYLPYWV